MLRAIWYCWQQTCALNNHNTNYIHTSFQLNHRIFIAHTRILHAQCTCGSANLMLLLVLTGLALIAFITPISSTFVTIKSGFNSVQFSSQEILLNQTSTQLIVTSRSIMPILNSALTGYIRLDSLKLAFLGHVINGWGISPDPSKSLPSCYRTVPSFQEWWTSLASSLPNQHTYILQPLCELLSHKKARLQGLAQELAFKAIKKELVKPTTLAPYTAPSFCRCLLLQFWRCSSPGATLGIVSTNYLHIMCNDSHWATLLSNWERTSPGPGLWEGSLMWLGSAYIVLETDHKPLVPLMDRPTLIVCHHVSFVSGFAWWVLTVYKDIVMPNARMAFVHIYIFHHNLQEWQGLRKEQMPQSMLPHWHVRGELTLCNNLLLRREAL